MPRRIFGVEPVEWLLEKDSVVICAGGGGIPVMYTEELAPPADSSSGSKP